MDIPCRGGGLLAGGRLKARLEAALGDRQIEDLAVKFAAVAAEIGAGHEIWLTRGRLVDAVRASYALPGIFDPVKFRGRWLFDGALVNPLPISVCRAMGAQVVLAVNLLSEMTGRGGVMMDPAEPHGAQAVTAAGASGEAPASVPRGGLFRRSFAAPPSGVPGITAVMADAFNISQDRILRSRLAGDPPDVLLSARLGKIGMFEFHRAAELIDILELGPHRTTRCEGFSRGMKQKVALAGALIHDPRLIMLDEPLTGIDAAIARQVKDLLTARVRDGATIILTTHILEVAERLASRIGIVDHGRLVAEGTLAELRAKAGRTAGVSTTSLEDVFLSLTGRDAMAS